MCENFHHVIASLRTVLAIAVVLLITTTCTKPEREPDDDAITPGDFLEALQDAEFPRPPASWDFQFPADHASHDRYRTEWWNLSGVLAGDGDRVFGIQLSLARVGVRAPPRESDSRWAASSVYAGLLSLSGTGFEGARTGQRVSRAALDLAGARPHPVRVWVEDWRLEQPAGADRAADLRLHVPADDLVVDLELRTSRPLIDSNEVTTEQSQPAAPLVFYLQPRFYARGDLRIDDHTTTVSGVASLEHAWGELPFPGGPVARDRFTLFLEDERELLCIRSHRVDGSGSATTSCILTGRERKALPLSGQGVELEPLDHWESERTGARYPVSWALRIPDRGIDLRIAAFSRAQEGDAWTRFWAGPVRVETAAGNQAGRGFVLLSGYGDSWR